MYEVEIRHEGLGAYRHIRGSNNLVVMRKAQAQQQAWEERWQKQQEREAITNERLAKREQVEEGREEARERREEAELALSGIDETLKSALDRNAALDWESLKDCSPFPMPKPRTPAPESTPVEPRLTEARFQPSLGLLDRLVTSRRERRRAEAMKAFEEAHSRWEHACKEIEKQNETRRREYETELVRWNKNNADFLEKQSISNAEVDGRRNAYLEKSPAAIIDYCDAVLASSIYPDTFPKSFEIEYIVESKTLVVDYQMPALEALPTVKDVKYVASRDDIVESYLTESATRKMYDGLLYEISLRSLNELFEADLVDMIDSIVLNGWVRSIDKGIGQEINPCILSIQALKKEFIAINLSQVDPKACFKKLKGVGSSKLSELAAIRPILRLNKEDRRFVSAYDVADTLDDSMNLAAMDWKDFENLIRELFEKVFSKNGGEVKITQASRDGGVDAIAFDPDPIRGGKIVIQAKRYTNTVGVSAVRDLYGTVHNEGAIKGILVTTADYGPDAYAFVKDKPLTLLNGSNLLHLLAEHGHRAKIDLREAKESLYGKGGNAWRR
jgi:restriction system protein